MSEVLAAGIFGLVGVIIGGLLTYYIEDRMRLNGLRAEAYFEALNYWKGNSGRFIENKTFQGVPWLVLFRMFIYGGKNVKEIVNKIMFQENTNEEEQKIFENLLIEITKETATVDAEAEPKSWWRFWR